MNHFWIPERHASYWYTSGSGFHLKCGRDILPVNRFIGANDHRYVEQILLAIPVANRLLEQ